MINLYDIYSSLEGIKKGSEMTKKARNTNRGDALAALLLSYFYTRNFLIFSW